MLTGQPMQTDDLARKRLQCSQYKLFHNNRLTLTVKTTLARN